MKLTGEAVFEDGRIVKDEEVFRQVVKHAKTLDLCDPKKVVGMTIACQTLLMTDPKALKGNWKFSEKDGIWE